MSELDMVAVIAESRERATQQRDASEEREARREDSGARLIRAILIVGLIALLASAAAIARPVAQRAESTAYCLVGTMADGTYTRPHSVAMNSLALGTKIELLGRRGPGGHKRYVVRDRIGYGTELDFWVPTCSQAYAWGRRNVRFRLGWSNR